MYEKFKKKLEKILDFYSIVNDREAIMKDLSEVVNEAYEKGRCDGMEEADSYYGEQDGEWED